MVGSDIAEYLRDYHNSEEEAIKARDLCSLFNLSNRDIRNIVNGLRQDGEPICSSSSGYWYSTEPADINKTIHRLEGQVKNMNNSINGLKKYMQEANDEDYNRYN
jgi:hypothetical protein